MSERRRWRPPSMKSEGTSDEVGETNSPAVRLDEKVVRKMLQVNPDMRAGRTTFQVKRDLERGTPAPGQPSLPSQSAQEDLSPPASPSPRGELAETLAFFVRGKTEALDETLAGIAERRRGLDDEESEARRQLVSQLVSFIALLDERQVAMHGVTTLSKHAAFLGQLGVTPAEVLDAARRARTNRT